MASLPYLLGEREMANYIAQVVVPVSHVLILLCPIGYLILL